MHPMGEDRALPRFEAVLKSMEQYLQPLFPLLSCPPEPRYCPGLPPEGLRTTGLLEPWGRRGMVSLHPHRCAQVPSIVTPRARVGGGLRVKASSASASELHGELSGWLWAWGGRGQSCVLLGTLKPTALGFLLCGIGWQMTWREHRPSETEAGLCPPAVKGEVWPHPIPFLGDVPAMWSPAALWSGCGGRGEPGKGPSPVDLGLGGKKLEGSEHGLPDRPAGQSVLIPVCSHPRPSLGRRPPSRERGEPRALMLPWRHAAPSQWCSRGFFNLNLCLSFQSTDPHGCCRFWKNQGQRQGEESVPVPG